MKNKLALGLTGLIITTGSTTAATSLIDWSSADDISGSADSNGNFWNTIGANSGVDHSTTNLVDEDQNALAWTVAVNNTLSGSFAGAGFGGAGINGPDGGGIPFNGADAEIDGIFANRNSEGTAVITFGGLEASSQYDFVAIGGRASGGNDGLITLLTGTNVSGFTGGTASLADSGALTSFSVTSSATGFISFDFSEGLNDADAGTNSTWNALSINGAAVPEPSSTALLGLGGLALILRRRK